MIIYGIMETIMGRIPCEIKTNNRTVEFIRDNRLQKCNLQSIHEYGWFEAFICNSTVEE